MIVLLIILTICFLWFCGAFCQAIILYAREVAGDKVASNFIHSQHRLVVLAKVFFLWPFVAKKLGPMKIEPRPKRKGEADIVLIYPE